MSACIHAHASQREKYTVSWNLNLEMSDAFQMLHVFVSLIISTELIAIFEASIVYVLFKRWTWYHDNITIITAADGFLGNFHNYKPIK